MGVMSGVGDDEDGEKGDVVQLSIGAFLIDYFAMTYTLIICNSLSMIPITDDKQGNILIFDYLPDWGLFIGLMCSLTAPCFTLCSKIVCNKKQNPCFGAIMFGLFSFPMMGLAFYLFNFAQEYPHLIETYNDNAGGDDDHNNIISNNYINTTEYLSELAIIVFALTWSQMCINICGCSFFIVEEKISNGNGSTGVAATIAGNGGTTSTV